MKRRKAIIKKVLCLVLSLITMGSLICIQDNKSVNAINVKTTKLSSSKNKKKKKSNSIVKYNTISSFYSDRTKYVFKYATACKYKIYNFKERDKVNKYFKDKTLEELYTNAVAVKENPKLFSTNYLSKTLNEDDAKYLYNGEWDKKNRPSGIGVLFEIPQYGEEKIPEVIYIGYFKDGYYSGYGSEFTNSSDDSGWAILSTDDEKNFYYFLNDVSYEGYFKKGKKSGKGNHFMNNASALISRPEYYYDTDEVGESYTDEDGNEIDRNLQKQMSALVNNLGYCVDVGEYKKGKMNGDFTMYEYGKLVYVGGYNEKSGYTGKGTLYFKETGKVKYKGEFRDGVYNGKGTLYDENGKIIHKGTFENGDIK